MAEDKLLDSLNRLGPDFAQAAWLNKSYEEPNWDIFTTEAMFAHVFDMDRKIAREKIRTWALKRDSYKHCVEDFGSEATLTAHRVELDPVQS